MKKLLRSFTIFIILCLLNVVLLAQEKDEKYWLAQDYVAQYKHFAIEEMHRTGIPASITLGQGLLESNYGRSRLATLANNHFGAKAHNTWTGPTIQHTDDAPDEHFRKYQTIEHSYRDHSKVLAKKRYAFLYHLNPFDYKAWAHGLKKAGYATDPKYAFKLIAIIERYALYIYDNPTYYEPTMATTVEKPTILQPNDPGYISATYTKPSAQVPVKTVIYTATVPVSHRKVKTKKAKRKKENYVPIQTKEATQINYSTNPNECVNLAMRASQNIKKRKPTWHKGNRALFFEQAVMPSQIAYLYDIDLRKILQWNYANANVLFEQGKPIYVEALRKKSGALGDKTYVVNLRGETLVDVALKSGIAVERLAKLNKIKNVLDFIATGETVNLKRKRRNKLKTIGKHHLEIVAHLPQYSTLVEIPTSNFTINQNRRPAIDMPKGYYTTSDYVATPVVVAPTTKNERRIIVGTIDHTTTAQQQQQEQLYTYQHPPTTTINKTAVASVAPDIIRPIESTNVVYHTVKKGQTLYRLSVIYGVSVDAIKVLNNLSNNTIKTGSQLRVK